MAFVTVIISSSRRESEASRYGEQKMAQFRTRDLTTELAYVSTRQSGQFTMDIIYKKCVELAWLSSTHVCKFRRQVAGAKLRHFLFATWRIVENFTSPKRRFWKDEQKMKCGVSIEFSTIRSPNLVLTPFKSASKLRISSFVHPSKIFVWGA